MTYELIKPVSNELLYIMNADYKCDRYRFTFKLCDLLKHCKAMPDSKTLKDWISAINYGGDVINPPSNKEKFKNWKNEFIKRVANTKTSSKEVNSYLNSGLDLIKKDIPQINEFIDSENN